ncbi:MAG: hypothetical protein ACREMB_20950 [Candidatus Rokuibacteriota bacterium]
MPRADLVLALLLAGVTTLSRIPHRARLLPTWDAVQFALALRDYDVVKHQPHPPGYILYIALARALEALTGDPAASLVGLAIAASGATVFLTYRLAWQVSGRATAVVAASALAASPLFWFYGVVGLPYTTEAALVTAVACLVWPMGRGRPGFLVPSALALALAGGVRQSILPLLFPLWLAMAWLGLRRWRPIVGGAAVMGAVTAAWLGPMVWLTGGLGAYVTAAFDLYDSTIRATTVAGAAGGWRVNVIALAEAGLLGLGIWLPALAGLGLAADRVGRWFFGAWILPPLAVYAAIHFGQHGYLLAILPALYVLGARGLVRGAARLSAGPPVRWMLVSAVLAVTVLGHAAFFVAAPTVDVPGLLAARPDASGWKMALLARYRFRLWPNTAPGLRDHERVIEGYVDAIRRLFDPADTLLVTELGNPRSYPWFRHVMYYLPEFAAYHLRVGHFSPGYLSSRHVSAVAALGGPEILLPASARRLVWVVDHWSPSAPRPPGLRAVPLPRGRWLYVLALERGAVDHAGYRLVPMTAVARLR